MHDTLDYFKKDPVHRKYHQNDMGVIYAFTENFMLASFCMTKLSSGVSLGRMTGDEVSLLDFCLLLITCSRTPNEILQAKWSNVGQPECKFQ